MICTNLRGTCHRILDTCMFICLVHNVHKIISIFDFLSKLIIYTKSRPDNTLHVHKFSVILIHYTRFDSGYVTIVSPFFNAQYNTSNLVPMGVTDVVYLISQIQQEASNLCPHFFEGSELLHNMM